MQEKEGITELKALYRQRIEQVQPEIKIAHFELITEGLVNDVVIINHQRVFRFGKQTWAAADLAHEAKCLSLAREYVEMPLPDWTVHAPDFVSYDLIPGVPLQRYELLRLPAGQQRVIAGQIGIFLNQLHAVPMTAVTTHNIGPSATNRSRETWLTLYQDVQTELFPFMMATARDWVHQHFAPLLTDPDFMAYTPCLMNGDLAAYHLLYDPQSQQLNGIIDFGTVGVGDPACDFACLLDQYGEPFLQQLNQTYGEIGSLIDRARFWAGTLELQWALNGVRHNDPEWYLVHLGRARDRLPVGCGWAA